MQEKNTITLRITKIYIYIYKMCICIYIYICMCVCKSKEGFQGGGPDGGDPEVGREQLELPQVRDPGAGTCFRGLGV